MNSVVNNPKISNSKNLERKENRFNYSMDIIVRTKSKRGQAKTINVSATGMKFSTKAPLKVSVNDFIYINIPELNEHINSLPENKEKNDCVLFMYEVLYVDKKSEDVNIACQYVGHSASDLKVLESYVEEKLQICKVDYSHDLNNAKYSYYEFLYFNDITSLVYFFSPSEKKCLFVESEKNRCLYSFITHPVTHRVDLSMFTSETHLNTLHRKLGPDKDFLLFIFWQNRQLHYYYDFELKNKEDLISILQHTIKNKGHVLKGCTQKVSLSQNKSDTSSRCRFPFSNSNTLQQVVLYDITKFISQCLLEQMGFNKNTSSLTSPANREQTIVYEHEFFLYNAHMQREEDRYLYHTHVSVFFNKEKVIQGETIDFSYSGTAILLNGHFNTIKPHSKVWLDYDDLNKTMSKLQLVKVLFNIKNVTTCPITNNTILGLHRVADKCHIDVKQFFDTVIDKNSSKLTVCRQEKLNHTEKQIIQNRLKESLMCIPVFLADNEDHKVTIKEIKIYNENCNLVQFFKTESEYDFSSLTRQKLLDSFSHYIQLKRHQSTPLIAFLVKIDNAIKIITNSEIRQSSALIKIASDTIKRKGLCLLIKFRRNNQFDDQAFEISSKTHHLKDQDEMNSAREKVSDICGYIELNDITSVIHRYL